MSTATTIDPRAASLAGVLVALKPRYGAHIVAAWLGGIIVDLLGALTLARLASVYDPPGTEIRLSERVSTGPLLD